MAHKIYTAHVGERGRIVIPAEVRRRLGVTQGTLLAFELDEGGSTVVEVRTAEDVARSGRGLLRNLAPGVDIAAELIRDRRAEAERESTGGAHAAER